MEKCIKKNFPKIYFHISKSFHYWFLFKNKGMVDDILFENIVNKISKFTKIWNFLESAVLQLIPTYTGQFWPFKEIHVYFFSPPEELNLPSIADPILINVREASTEFILILLLHELVHYNLLYCKMFNTLNTEIQEACVCFIVEKILKKCLNKKKAMELISNFTKPYFHNYPEILKKYKKKINLSKGNILSLIEKGIIR